MEVISVVVIFFLFVFFGYIYFWKEPKEREEKRKKEEERKKRRDEENRREREYRKKISESEKAKLRLLEAMLEIDEEEKLSVCDNEMAMESLGLYEIKFIYHMTNIDNLSMILSHGLLPHGNRYVAERIDNKDVNERRNRKDPIYGKVIHDYVPFYLNPKNPMLFVNRYRQNGIIILAFSNNLFFREGAVFTNGNAAKSNTKFFNSLDCLGEINWDCIKAEYWNSFENGKSERMAEVLVPDQVEINSLCHIICFDERQRAYVNRIAPGIKTIVDRNMYF